LLRAAAAAASASLEVYTQSHHLRRHLAEGLESALSRLRQDLFIGLVNLRVEIRPR